MSQLLAAQALNIASIDPSLGHTGQTLTRRLVCRQYASFQDKYHLYMLFDLMLGGDLMDVLVAEAKVIKRRDPQGGWKRGCLAPKVGLS